MFEEYPEACAAPHRDGPAPGQLPHPDQGGQAPRSQEEVQRQVQPRHLVLARPQPSQGRDRVPAAEGASTLRK